MLLYNYSLMKSCLHLHNLRNHNVYGHAAMSPPCSAHMDARPCTGEYGGKLIENFRTELSPVLGSDVAPAHFV